MIPAHTRSQSGPKPGAEPDAGLSPQPLSAPQTWNVLGGVRRGCSATPLVRAIDVTRAIRDLRPGLPEGSRVAAIHIGLLPFLFAGKSKQFNLQRQIIAAEPPLLRKAFTHLLITGPFVDEARRRSRLNPIYAFRNHAFYAIPFHWLYHIVISARLLVPFGLTDRRRSNLNHKRANARTGFRLSVVFELQEGPPKP